MEKYIKKTFLEYSRVQEISISKENNKILVKICLSCYESWVVSREMFEREMNIITKYPKYTFSFQYFYKCEGF